MWLLFLQIQGASLPDELDKFFGGHIPEDFLPEDYSVDDDGDEEDEEEGERLVQV